MSFGPIKFQIGKNGITPTVLESLALAFKNRRQVRIATLKSSGRDRDSIEKMATEIAEYLAENGKYRLEYKIIGFTIVMNRRQNYPKQGL